MPLDHAEAVALALSFKVSLVGVFASLPFALGCAWLLARTRFFGKPLFEGLLLLPLILPPVVTGYVLLIVFGHHGAIGRLLDAAGLSFALRWWAATRGASGVVVPLHAGAWSSAFWVGERKLENAAATLGAGPWRIFFGITLPLSVRGLVAGLALAFARAFGEFGATITFVSSIPGQTRTLPIALYELISTPGGEGGALRLTLVAVTVALLASLVAALMLLRGRSRPSEIEA